MARPIPTHATSATPSTHGACAVTAGPVASVARSLGGTARTSYASTSTPAISDAPQSAFASSDVGADSAPASLSYVMHVRKMGMGALGRRTPAR